LTKSTHTYWLVIGNRKHIIWNRVGREREREGGREGESEREIETIAQQLL
jgi:hypothetical protein